MIINLGILSYEEATSQDFWDKIGNMMSFRQWENEVNELMLEHYGVGVDDIPDMPYHDWFTSEMAPAVAVIEAIAIVNEGGF